MNHTSTGLQYRALPSTRALLLFRVSSSRNLSTLCLKKVPTFKLSVTLSNLTDFQNFCTAEKRMKFVIKPHNNTHLTLGMLLHYLGK